jgi:putative transposase
MLNISATKAIHGKVKGTYGSRCMHRELKGRDHRIGLARVERFGRRSSAEA